MNFKPLFLAFPIFVILMLLEYWLTRNKAHKTYHFEETISNLTCGVGHLLFDVFFRLGVFVIYDYFSFISITKIENSFLSTISLFILIDFIYYWYHRLSHEVKILWAIHSVHHQSEYYNFSVGLRQAWLHKLSAFWIYILPAFLGFSSIDYLIVASVHAVLQIWTHTELYNPQIGYLKYLFVTPQHHKLHHGKNKIYVNKNYAGILSLWDYLFNTNVEETEDVKYGVNNLNVTYNSFESNWIQFSTELKKLVFPNQLKRNNNSSPKSTNNFFQNTSAFKIVAILRLILVLLLSGFFIKDFYQLNGIQIFSCFSYVLLCISTLGIQLDKKESFIYWEVLNMTYAIFVLSTFPDKHVFNYLIMLQFFIETMTLFFIYLELFKSKLFSFKIQS